MKSIIALAFSIAVSVAMSGTFTLLQGVHNKDFDWESGDSYEGGVAPGENDTLVIPEDVTAKINASSASFKSF